MIDGTIIAYSNDAYCGVIKDPEGKNYYFSRSEWRSKSTPKNGMTVKFEPLLGKALRVDPVPIKSAA